MWQQCLCEHSKMLCYTYIACVVLDGLYWWWDGTVCFTGHGMAGGGCCRYVVVFFSVSFWQSVVLCCTLVTQKWWLTLDQRSGWRSGLAKGYKMWHYTVLLGLPFMYFVLLVWRWPSEVETCCQIKDITLASCSDGSLFLLLWEIYKKFNWLPRPVWSYFSAFLQN